jgi:hypothetical protein
VGDSSAVGAANAADDLPAGLGADQVDVASGTVVPAVEVVLDPLRHVWKLERMFDSSNAGTAVRAGINRTNIREEQACSSLDHIVADLRKRHR